jgi:hypothetical protein
MILNIGVSVGGGGGVLHISHAGDQATGCTILTFAVGVGGGGGGCCI